MCVVFTMSERGQVERWKSPMYVNILCIKIDYGLSWKIELLVLKTEQGHIQ